MQIKSLNTPEEIAKSFATFQELRPSLIDVEDFVRQVIEQQKEGYKILVVLKQEEIVACMGFRIMTMLAWGKILYIDDLITKAKHRGLGYSKKLLEAATKIAGEKNCDQIHLDSGYQRYAAHRFYLNYGFELHCHHLALKLNNNS